MKKIKIISASSTDDLEKVVDAWLERHPKVELVDFQLTVKEIKTGYWFIGTMLVKVDADEAWI